MIVQDKTYEISAAAGKRIKMTFAAFSLENDRSCGWDYLTVSHHCNIQILITVKLIANTFCSDRGWKRKGGAWQVLRVGEASDGHQPD